MPLPDYTDNTVWNYIYTHDRTEETTGYFSCLPERSCSLEEDLDRLANRPLDSFLHRKLLSDIVSLSPGDLERLASVCLSSCEPIAGNPEKRTAVLATLLLESSIVSEANYEVLNKYLADLKHIASFNLSPFIFMPRPEKRAENEFYANAIRDLTETGLNGVSFQEGAPEKKGLLEVIHEDFVFSGSIGEPVPAREMAQIALERLARAQILHGPEMRHEASLSPIALLRQWRVFARISHNRHRHEIDGLSTAYGRGLSLAQARASCLMEIVERASAYVSVMDGGEYASGEIANLNIAYPLIYASAEELKGEKFYVPPNTDCYKDIPVHWIEGTNALGEKVFAPLQSVFLFSNLDEASIYEQEASTGLASGDSFARAKLAALTEILERDANATALFNQRQCFIPRSRDEVIQGLLDDYRYKGIYLILQDIGGETGFPVYRCIVRDREGKAHYATGANLNGRDAALSALTETPWPYSWSSPYPSQKFSVPPPGSIPARFLEDLPDYSLKSVQADLALMEKFLSAEDKSPVYFDLSRADIQLPVIRAFIPGMETNCEYDQFHSPGPRFFIRNNHILKRL